MQIRLLWSHQRSLKVSTLAKPAKRTTADSTTTPTSVVVLGAEDLAVVVLGAEDLAVAVLGAEDSEEEAGSEVAVEAPAAVKQVGSHKKHFSNQLTKQHMKIQKANLALAIGILMMSFSGCASLSLQPTNKAELPITSQTDSVEFKFGLARLLERNGKLEEARRAYLEILSLQAHTPSLHRLGVTAIRQNRLEAGLSHLSEAVNAGNPTAELLGDFGFAQYLVGDLTGAEKTLTNAVTMNPSLKRNLNNLAIVVGNQDRLNESFQLFRQASPEAEALANLAFIQAQSNDLSQAQANYNRALDLDPELEIAAVGLMEVHKHLQTQTENELTLTTVKSPKLNQADNLNRKKYCLSKELLKKGSLRLKPQLPQLPNRPVEIFIRAKP